MNPIKPLQYRDVYPVMQDASYTLVNEDGEVIGFPQSGTLKVGRVAWLHPPGEIKSLEAAHVVAWADETGTVSISRNVLAPLK